MSNKYYDKYISDEGPNDAAILIVGEAGGADEHEQGRPFVGASGDLLINVLERNGSSRGEVRLANLSHNRPHDNKFENLLGTEALRNGVQALHSWIAEHRSSLKLIVPVGYWPLLFMTGKKGIMKWRGSILPYINDPTLKVIPTLHPAAVLRKRQYYPTFDIDFKRIISDSKFPEFRLPQRTHVTDPRGYDLEEWVEKLCAAEMLAVDIEAVKKSTTILCVGFAMSPDVGVCLPVHSRFAIERILMSQAKKVYQFGSYDTTMLRLNGYQLNDPSAEELGRSYYWDTMIAAHVMEPELPRSLGYLTSVYTREPYYKHSGKDSIPADDKEWNEKVDRDTLWVYNSKDCCVTYEIAVQQMEELKESKIHSDLFQYQMEMIEVAAHISDAGMLQDIERKEMLREVLLDKWARKQAVLELLTQHRVNVRSPKLKNLLYDKEKMNLPARRNREGDLTTDEDAIVSLIGFCKGKAAELKTESKKMEWEVKLSICKLILEIRGIRQMLSNYILAKVGADNRSRSLYKVAGTETGRWSAKGYVDGTGYNAQTNPRDPVEVPEEYLTKPVVDVTLIQQLNDDDLIEQEEVEVAA